MVRRGVHDALAVNKTLALGSTLFILVLGWGLGCRWKTTPGSCSLTQIHTGAGAVLILGGIVLGFNLIVAPFRIHREQAELLASISKPPKAPSLRLTSPAVATEGYHTTQSGTLPLDWRFFISQGSGGVALLSRKHLKDLPHSIECWVEDPAGKRHQAELKRDKDSVRCEYPTDFHSANPATGQHFVHWLAATTELGYGAREGSHAHMRDPMPFVMELGPGN